ncbi:relaxase domain-containing protein, partial [Shewanella sairae]
MILHSDFGARLEKMGYSIKSMGNGQIDVDGIPQEVIDANSTRRHQLLDHAKALGIDSGKSRDYAAQLTRKPKAYTPEQSLQQEWTKKNSDLGFNGLDFVTKSYDKPAPI